MKIQLYAKRAPHHKEWIGAFAEGLAKHGLNFNIQIGGGFHAVDADLHVFWSMHHPAIIQHCRNTDQPFICLERGYIDRMNFSSINLNGLNGRSMLDLKEHEENGDRVGKYRWYIEPRDAKGRELIVIGQTPGDASMEGQDLHLWALNALQYFEGCGYAPLFKPHPLDKQRPYDSKTFQGYPIFEGNIDDALAEAYCFVTYSSNAGVDAWINGVNAISESPVSMLHKWQGRDGKCLSPKRWLCDLSFRQYNAEEMRKGEAWQIIKEKILPPSYGKHDS